MNVNIARHLGAVQRQTGTRSKDGKLARFITASRVFDTTPEEVWDAISNPERIPRWFLPVKVELEGGRTFSFEDAAHGQLEACEAGHRLSFTWEFAGDIGWIDVTLHQEHRHTRITVEHVAFVSDEQWQKFGPGLLGLGWEQTLLRLAVHLDSGVAVVPGPFLEWLQTPNGKQFIQGASDAWAEAAVKANGDPVEAHQAATRVAEQHARV
ncbi:MAG: polyketide cyclase [Archangium gephyra]|uniref:Polyketide cyclase n=1 Tax=Archangium gephyra TaxID=48 RepID=A0A2W5UZC3_9BACT|nr:MAG: polyketide cyclase [Archangium gephyra]